MFIISLRLFSENKIDGQQSITLHRPSILNFIHFKILSYILKSSSLQTLKISRILLPVSASHLRTVYTAISAARRFGNINTPRRDAAECDAFQAVLCGHVQAGSIAGGRQPFVFFRERPLNDGTDGVDHIISVQIISRRSLCTSGRFGIFPPHRQDRPSGSSRNADSVPARLHKEYALSRCSSADRPPRNFRNRCRRR